MTKLRIAAAALLAFAPLTGCLNPPPPGTITVGEDLDPVGPYGFDVPAGGRLDLVMYHHTTYAPSGWMAQGTPEKRCQLYGGTLTWRYVGDGTTLLICEDVNF